MFLHGFFFFYQVNRLMARNAEELREFQLADKQLPGISGELCLAVRRFGFTPSSDAIEEQLQRPFPCCERSGAKGWASETWPRSLETHRETYSFNEVGFKRSPPGQLLEPYASQTELK